MIFYTVSMAPETLLDALAERDDVRLGIATGHLSYAITPALERFGWHKHFCTVQTVDKAVKRGAMHRNTGARKKSRAARVRAGQPSA